MTKWYHRCQAIWTAGVNFFVFREAIWITCSSTQPSDAEGIEAFSLTFRPRLTGHCSKGTEAAKSLVFNDGLLEFLRGLPRPTQTRPGKPGSKTCGTI